MALAKENERMVPSRETGVQIVQDLVANRKRASAESCCG